jgi:hypothetical protein
LHTIPAQSPHPHPHHAPWSRHPRTVPEVRSRPRETTPNAAELGMEVTNCALLRTNVVLATIFGGAAVQSWGQRVEQDTQKEQPPLSHCETHHSGSHTAPWMQV